MQRSMITSRLAERAWAVTLSRMPGLLSPGVRCILSGEYASILLLTGGFCAAAPFALMGIRGGHDFTFHIDRRGSRTKSERWPGR